MGVRKMRKWLFLGIVCFIVLLVGILFYFFTSSSTMMNHNMHQTTSALEESKGINEVAIPPILKPDRVDQNDVYFTIRAQEGPNGTMGYNGTFLGPVIPLKTGQVVHLTEKNELREETTYHLHGLEVPGEVDGGPQNVISPGTSRTVVFPVMNPASTLWFHPHAMGSTAKQVYKGLAGLFYVTDKQSDALLIPKTYGVNDFPLILQDRMVDNGQVKSYEDAYNSDGIIGNKLMINGTFDPKLTVSSNLVRLRLLNGSNARNLALRFTGGESFQQIASDGGYLAAPVQLSSISISPGERAEIVVDFTKMTGKNIAMESDDGTIVLPFQVKKSQGSDIDQTLKTLPSSLVPIKAIDSETLQVTKTIKLFGMMNMVSINGKQYDMNRIDFTQKVGQEELWEVYNEKDMMGGMIHPFHIHGTQVRVISVDGNSPPANLQGWKDTVAIRPGEKVRLVVKFNYPGTYMFHCHNLEHEESGMMGQIQVNP
jgi:blue copper oxidase